MTEELIVAITDEITPISTGNAQMTFRVPKDLNLQEVRASLTNASTAGAISVDVNRNGTSIFSTPLTIDENEETSNTAATASVLDTNSLIANDEISIDIDAAGTAGDATGLKLTFVFEDSDRVPLSFILAASDETTAITTGPNKTTFRSPYAFTLASVRASLTSPSTSGIVTVDINKNGTTILSTKLTIDANEETSLTAAAAAVISDTSIANDDEITIDVDTPGTGATGLKVTLIARESVSDSSEGSGTGLTASQSAFFDEVARDGDAFRLSNDVFVNRENLTGQDNSALGLPQQYNDITIIPNADGTTAVAIDLNPHAFNFSNLVGGILTLNLNIHERSKSGSAPDGTSLVLRWNAADVTFTFPLRAQNDFNGSTEDIVITIPNRDYSAIFNVPPDSVTLNVAMRGANWFGNIAINSITNNRTGPLHDAAVDLINRLTGGIRPQLERELQAIRDGILDPNDAINRILDRISPLRTVVNEASDVGNVLWFNPTDNSVPPLSSFSALSDGSEVALTTNQILVAVRVDSVRHVYVLEETTTQNEISSSAANTNANLSVEASRSFEGATWFIYRITGLIPNTNISFFQQTESQEEAWPVDIQRNKDAIAALRTFIMSHPAITAPEANLSWFNNDLTIEQQDNTTLVSTLFNTNFTPFGQQSFLEETVPTSPGLGAVKTSNSINSRTGAARGRKLFYLRMPQTLTDGASLLRTSTNRDLLLRRGNNLVAQMFRPANPGGVQNVTRYPLPALDFQRDWYDIDILEFVNGLPTAVSNELLFTRNLPTTSTTVSIAYRGLTSENDNDANSIFGTGSVNLAGVGGPNNVQTTVTISDGAESVTITIIWRAATRDLLIRAVPSVARGLAAVRKVEVHPTWVESVNLPATPEGTTDRVVGTYTPGGVVPIAIGPSLANRVSNDANTLIMVTSSALVNTGFTFNTLFGENDTGTISMPQTAITQQNAIYDYIFVAHQSLLSTIANQVNVPYFGLFTENHTSETVAKVDTQFEARNAENREVAVGQRPSTLFTGQNMSLVSLTRSQVEANRLAIILWRRNSNSVVEQVVMPLGLGNSIISQRLVSGSPVTLVLAPINESSDVAHQRIVASTGTNIADIYLVP